MAEITNEKIRTRIRQQLTRGAAKAPDVDKPLYAAFSQAVAALPLDAFAGVVVDSRGDGGTSSKVAQFPGAALWMWLELDPEKALPVVGHAMKALYSNLEWAETIEDVEGTLCHYAHLAGVIRKTSTALWGSPTHDEIDEAKAMTEKLQEHYK